jgi:hypothetical protein
MKNLLFGLGLVSLVFGGVLLTFGNTYGIIYLMGGFVLLKVMEWSKIV